MRRLCLLVCIALALGACGEGNAPPPTRENPATTPPQPVSTLSPVLIDLQRNFEALQASHQAIAQIWESLAAGEQVACCDYPGVLPPGSISAGDAPAYEELANGSGAPRSTSRAPSRCGEPNARTRSPDRHDQRAAGGLRRGRAAQRQRPARRDPALVDPHQRRLLSAAIVALRWRTSQSGPARQAPRSEHGRHPPSPPRRAGTVPPCPNAAPSAMTWRCPRRRAALRWR